MTDDLHSVLRRQLADATAADGAIDLDRLVDSVNRFYTSHDREVRRIDRANRLMAEELEDLLAMREQEAEERRDRILALERAQAEIAASEARNRHLAFHDALTGLPNRALFGERLTQGLAQLIRSDARLAVHCIDLDQFKMVNDTYGHQAGDELICAAAQRFQSTCRRSDTIARLGGDEFAIVQTDCSNRTAAELATRIIEQVSRPFQLSFGTVAIGCSIGITIVSGTDINATEAMRQADLALYRAKDAGRGQYALFEVDMDAAVKTRRALQSDLREALNRGELNLVYQPQVNQHDRIIGLEALCRWRHPERGDVPPLTFIPLAEESGLISQLGYFTLRRAFEQAAQWPDLKVAVNVAAQHLRSRGFSDQVAALVQELGVRPRQFELEITEGVLLEDDAATHEALHALRAMGFTLVLDDFGTGYSSLSYLQRYPIDKLKIDRSFIADIGVRPGAEAVISAIVRLAEALNLMVIAEGVETEAQRILLTRAGCTDIQGYLTGRPMSASKILRMLGKPSPRHGFEAALPVRRAR